MKLWVNAMTEHSPQTEKLNAFTQYALHDEAAQRIRLKILHLMQAQNSISKQLSEAWAEQENNNVAMGKLVQSEHFNKEVWTEWEKSEIRKQGEYMLLYFLALKGDNE